MLSEPTKIYRTRREGPPGAYQIGATPGLCSPKTVFLLRSPFFEQRSGLCKAAKMLRAKREAAKKAEGERSTKRRRPSQKALAAQLGTSPTLCERKGKQLPVKENLITAESPEEGENSVFVDPLGANSVPSSKRSSGSDTEREEETHDLEPVQTLAGGQEASLAAEAQETPKKELDSPWKARERTSETRLRTPK